ncbi:MAG: tetratricopeptide repeat protein [Actinomycetota bacterium]|nr:tetratricopeptide repeat protein [Actinomycetota bacterium]
MEAGRGEECRHYLNEAATELVDVEPVPAHLSLALTRLHLAYRSGNSVEVDTAIAEVQRLGDPMGSPRARAMVLIGRYHLALASGHYVEGRTQLSALRVLTAELGDAFGEQVRGRPAIALELLGAVAFFAGEWEQTLQRSCEVVDLAQRVGLPRGTALGLTMRGLVLLRRGRLDEALPAPPRHARRWDTSRSPTATSWEALRWWRRRWHWPRVMPQRQRS